VIFIGPQEGHLASGKVGIGRMSEALDILGQARFILGKNGVLKGRKIIVTAGPTQEPIDPVRIISNRSSGKQGFELAQAGLDLGAQVTLVSGQVHLTPPSGADFVNAVTALEMKDAVFDALPNSDVLIMAAAVSDYAPLSVLSHKIKKEGSTLDLNLERTVDILQAVSEYRRDQGTPRLVVGFAAESQTLIENARSKLNSKHLDLIIANDVTIPGAGFSGDTNQVTLLFKDGQTEQLPMLAKSEVARIVMERVAVLLSQEFT
jgi:phosphopantothenoylcysteine decarboxylase/phosphopantothenate--cysteine ligase